MIDIMEVVAMLTAFQLLRTTHQICTNNLKDVAQTFGRLPEPSANFFDIVKWFKDNPDWKEQAKCKLDMFKIINGALEEEGYDRWSKSPEDGGIPF